MIPKMRVWDSKEQRMLHPGDYTMEIDKWGVHVLDNHDQVISVDEQEDIMQSTGIKDINGIEVFEGDIVRFRFLCDDKINVDGVIVWMSNKACFGIDVFFINEKFELHQITKEYLSEVLSNKYEASELIEFLKSSKEDE